MLDTSRRDTCHSALYMLMQAHMLFLLHHTTSMKFVFKPREEFWKWIITIRHTQWLGKVDDYIHMQKCQHCLFITGKKDGGEPGLPRQPCSSRQSLLALSPCSSLRNWVSSSRCWALALSSLGLQGLHYLTPIIHTIKYR